MFLLKLLRALFSILKSVTLLKVGGGGLEKCQQMSHRGRGGGLKSAKKVSRITWMAPKYVLNTRQSVQSNTKLKIRFIFVKLVVRFINRLLSFFRSNASDDALLPDVRRQTSPLNLAESLPIPRAQRLSSYDEIDVDCNHFQGTKVIESYLFADWKIKFRMFMQWKPPE